MSECKHCWHNMGQWTDTTGTHRSRKCCHCGQFVQEDVEYRPPHVGTGGTALPQHGPHVPQPGVMW